MKELTKHPGLNKTNPVKIHVFETVKLKYPFHYHPEEYELTLTLGSKGIRVVGDTISNFGDSDLTLIGPGVPHCWINDFPNDSGIPETIQVIVIHFNEHLIGKELIGRPEFHNINQLLKASTRGLAFPSNINDQVTSKILNLKLEPDFNTFINLLEIFNLLGESEQYKLLSSEQYQYKGRPKEQINFEKVFDYIQNNYTKKIKISKVASIINMNDSAFSHYFRKRTSNSFTGFVNELRLNNALNQLVYSSRSISDICFESGFNNLSNFNRIFKKWKGTTPLQWKKEYLQYIN